MQPQRLAAAAVLLLTCWAVCGTAAAEGNCTHTIVKGDTLYQLSEAYGTQLDVLEELNPDIDPELLQIGEVIAVPCPEEPAPCTHTVEQGDTVEMIAEQYGVNSTAIMELNPGLVPERLDVGEEIAIPCPPACKYSIQQGDTLSALAELYLVDEATLVALNPGIAPSALAIGQEINVPCEV